jgi:hypothetical protein
LVLLAVAVWAAGVLLSERAVVRSEGEQRVLSERWEQDHAHGRDIAAAFLRAVVEDDFSATRPLLERVARTTPRSPEGRGPEVALREKVEAWFAARKLDRSRLKGYGFGGHAGGTSLVEGRCVHVGALLFDDGKHVTYVLTLVRTDSLNGSGLVDTNCWRVRDLVLWAGEGDGPRPW